MSQVQDMINLNLNLNLNTSSASPSVAAVVMEDQGIADRCGLAVVAAVVRTAAYDTIIFVFRRSHLREGPGRWAGIRGGPWHRRLQIHHDVIASASITSSSFSRAVLSPAIYPLTLPSSSRPLSLNWYRVLFLSLFVSQYFPCI